MAAQNVLLKKLGVVAEGMEPDAEAISSYAELFEAGLSDSQVAAIEELFLDHPRCVEEEERDDGGPQDLP